MGSGMREMALKMPFEREGQRWKECNNMWGQFGSFETCRRFCPIVILIDVFSLHKDMCHFMAARGKSSESPLFYLFIN